MKFANNPSKIFKMHPASTENRFRYSFSNNINQDVCDFKTLSKCFNSWKIVIRTAIIASCMLAIYGRSVSRFFPCEEPI